MRPTNEVLNILESCRIDGQEFYLPGQLDRKTYLDVNKVIELCGGKWNRGAKCHLFSEDPTGLIETVILTGEVTDAKKEFNFFETPEPVARQVILLAEIWPEHTILEPSAGRGALLKFMLQTKSAFCELHPANMQHMKERFPGATPLAEDFMSLQSYSFDRIIANPPFTRQQDVDHVTHMYELLNPGGVLVSVMSPGWQFRENRKSQAFRNLIEETEAEVIDLPDGSFKQSGTMVRTCIVKMRKAA